MAGTPFREVEEVLGRHARRLTGELGRLLIDVGRALRSEAEAPSRSSAKVWTGEASRDDLYREASKLGVKGRSRMSKEELRAAVARAHRGGARG